MGPKLRMERRHLFQGAHDPNSLLHGGFAYLERRGDDLQETVRETLIPDDRGKRHLTMPLSGSEDFRPGRRVLAPELSGSAYDRPQGLKKIQSVPRATPRPMGLRVNVEAAGRSGYDVPERRIMLQSKQIVIDDEGIPARYHVSGELAIEKAFGIKKRVRTHRDQRGGIPAKGNLGDKPYKKVDHCPGIQQAGEFIVGSSFYRTRCRQQTSQGAPVQDAVVPEGLGYALGHRKPRMNFHETREARQYLDDLRGVLELTDTSVHPTHDRQGAPPPTQASDDLGRESWEDKTGMHTWPKKAKPSVTTDGTG